MGLPSGEERETTQGGAERLVGELRDLGKHGEAKALAGLLADWRRSDNRKPAKTSWRDLVNAVDGARNIVADARYERAEFRPIEGEGW